MPVPHVLQHPASGRSGRCRGRRRFPSTLGRRAVRGTCRRRRWCWSRRDSLLATADSVDAAGRGAFAAELDETFGMRGAASGADQQAVPSLFWVHGERVCAACADWAGAVVAMLPRDGDGGDCAGLRVCGSEPFYYGVSGGDGGDAGAVSEGDVMGSRRCKTFRINSLDD